MACGNIVSFLLLLRSQYVYCIPVRSFFCSVLGLCQIVLEPRRLYRPHSNWARIRNLDSWILEGSVHVSHLLSHEPQAHMDPFSCPSHLSLTIEERILAARPWPSIGHHKSKFNNPMSCHDYSSTCQLSSWISSLPSSCLLVRKHALHSIRWAGGGWWAGIEYHRQLTNNDTAICLLGNTPPSFLLGLI